MPIEYDPELGKRFADPAAGGAAQLPFPAPVIWWMNGNPEKFTRAGAEFFGGWAMNADDMPILTDSRGPTRKHIHGFEPISLSNPAGETYAVYMSRSVMCAPVVTRRRWVENRSHVQTLVYLATKHGDKIVPWGPAVLSCKGIQSAKLTNAFREWGMVTTNHRRSLFDGIPSWFFYCMLGTFGGERVVEMVGKNQQSPITPIQLWKPDPLTIGHIEKLFVGNGVINRMLDMQKHARDWVNDWDTETPQPSRGPSPIGNNLGFYRDDDYPELDGTPF